MHNEITQAKAAEIMRVSRRMLAYARIVLNEGGPALVEAVRQGKIKVSTAARIVRLSQGSVQKAKPEKRVTSKKKNNTYTRFQPHPKKYESVAAKQRAYRARLKRNVTTKRP